MTLKEVVNQLHGMTNGNINKTVLTKKELRETIKRETEGDTETFFLLLLPDSNKPWLVSLWHNKKYGYDYYLPDNRVEEEALLQRSYDEYYWNGVKFVEKEVNNA